MNEELNKAIYKVLTSQFKKDNIEAFRLVEKAGYKIYKHDGVFYIKNTEKRNEIFCSFGYRGYFNRNNHSSIILTEKIDFVGCLETERKKNYKTHIESQAIINYQNKIYNPKYSINYYKESIEKIKEKIKQLEKDIIQYEEDIKRYEIILDDNRKKLHLKGGK